MDLYPQVNNYYWCKHIVFIVSLSSHAFKPADYHSSDSSVQGGKSMTFWEYTILLISFPDKYYAEGEEIGFAVVRQGSIVNPDASGSGKRYETVMTWRCGPDANWDPSSNNVTNFAINVTYSNSSYSVSRLDKY